MLLADGPSASPLALAALACLALGSAATLLCGGSPDGGGPAPAPGALLAKKDCDPAWVVSDEVAGQGLALALARLAPGGGWIAAGAAFLAFRALDVLKPWPIRALERLPGAAGILLDDLAAGAAAGAVVAAGTAAFA